LAGFSAFLRRLEAGWPRVLAPFALALLATSLVWLAVAPLYALGLAAVGRAAAPFIENTPGARYTVDGSRVLVRRPVRLPAQSEVRDVVYTVWLASGAFGLPVLAALILATPGWGARTRGRALVWGLGLLSLTQVASLLVSVEFWQQMPVRIRPAPVFFLPGHSPTRLQVASALYYFLEIIGRSFFVLVVYVALLGIRETPRPARGTGRNAACPCGSGRKVKRCCGVAA
jgi:hypothetical protein